MLKGPLSFTEVRFSRTKKPFSLFSGVSSGNFQGQLLFLGLPSFLFPSKIRSKCRFGPRTDGGSSYGERTSTPEVGFSRTYDVRDSFRKLFSPKYIPPNPLSL